MKVKSFLQRAVSSNSVCLQNTLSHSKGTADLLEEAHYRQGGAVHWKPQSILGPAVYCKQGCAGLCRVGSHVVPLLLLCKKQGQCPDGAIRKEKQNLRTSAVWIKKNQLLKIKIWAFIDSPLSCTKFHNVLLQQFQPEYSLSLYRTADCFKNSIRNPQNCNSTWPSKRPEMSRKKWTVVLTLLVCFIEKTLLRKLGNRKAVSSNT